MSDIALPGLGDRAECPCVPIGLIFPRPQSVRVWDAETGAPVGEPMRHNDPIKFAAFSPDGERILTITGPDPFAPMLRITNPSRPPPSSAMPPPGDAAQIWDLKTGRPVAEPVRISGSVSAAVYSSDGRHIAAIVAGGLQVWDALTGAILSESPEASTMIASAELSRDGSHVLAASRDEVFVWDIKSAKRVGEPIRNGGEFASASFSPDESQIVTVSRDMSVRRWQTVTGAPFSRRWRTIIPSARPR